MQFVAVNELDRAIDVRFMPLRVITRPFDRFGFGELLALKEGQSPVFRTECRIGYGFESVAFKICFILFLN